MFHFVTHIALIHNSFSLAFGKLYTKFWCFLQHLLPFYTKISLNIKERKCYPSSLFVVVPRVLSFSLFCPVPMIYSVYFAQCQWFIQFILPVPMILASPIQWHDSCVGECRLVARKVASDAFLHDLAVTLPLICSTSYFCSSNIVLNSLPVSPT